MYNYFMLIGTLEEDFIGPEGNAPIVKVKCQHTLFDQRVLPVNVTRVQPTIVSDFIYKGDPIAITGIIDLDNKGNLELLAERLMILKRDEQS